MATEAQRTAEYAPIRPASAPRVGMPGYEDNIGTVLESSGFPRL